VQLTRGERAEGQRCGTSDAWCGGVQRRRCPALVADPEAERNPRYGGHSQRAGAHLADRGRPGGASWRSRATGGQLPADPVLGAPQVNKAYHCSISGLFGLLSGATTKGRGVAAP
jgi:hypothetical protein